ncbi:hypothetical protein Dda_0664 [Drechslerella dactyloides]|uniref:Uncharacterized protein n=1 Tax=Drechslerella dactyloides TaxID=74499 RepID=A0AAD6NN75_DREDA|nr:hypothetical protein Dda_0664 [Drechslerella dactyloides]
MAISQAVMKAPPTTIPRMNAETIFGDTVSTPLHEEYGNRKMAAQKDLLNWVSDIMVNELPGRPKPYFGDGGFGVKSKRNLYEWVVIPNILALTPGELERLNGSIFAASGERQNHPATWAVETLEAVLSLIKRGILQAQRTNIPILPADHEDLNNSQTSRVYPSSTRARANKRNISESSEEAASDASFEEPEGSESETSSSFDSHDSGGSSDELDELSAEDSGKIPFRNARTYPAQHLEKYEGKEGNDKPIPKEGSKLEESSPMLIKTADETIDLTLSSPVEVTSHSATILPLIANRTPGQYRTPEKSTPTPRRSRSLLGSQQQLTPLSELVAQAKKIDAELAKTKALEMSPEAGHKGSQEQQFKTENDISTIAGDSKGLTTLEASNDLQKHNGGIKEYRRESSDIQKDVSPVEAMRESSGG